MSSCRMTTPVIMRCAADACWKPLGKPCDGVDEIVRTTQSVCGGLEMAQLPHIDSFVRGDDHPRKWAAMAVLGAVAFMAQLDLFVVNVALPAMGDTYAGASLSTLSWVLNAYTVVFAALLIPAGRLADHFGRRRFLVVGTIVFTVASALCAAAPSLAILIGGRTAQAVGAAVIVPTSLGLL